MLPTIFLQIVSLSKCTCRGQTSKSGFNKLLAHWVNDGLQEPVTKLLIFADCSYPEYAAIYKQLKKWFKQLTQLLVPRSLVTMRLVERMSYCRKEVETKFYDWCMVSIGISISAVKSVSSQYRACRMSSFLLYRLLSHRYSSSTNLNWTEAENMCQDKLPTSGLTLTPLYDS